MISFIHWLAQHWFEAAQTGGILAGLIFTAVSLRNTLQAQKITNLFTLTRYQRELYVHSHHNSLWMLELNK